MLTDLPRSTGHPDDRSKLQQELDFLFGRINYERSPGVSYPRHFKLESMRRLLAELGDPQTQYPIIHVAGTKGKGSVCHMIAGALNEAGIVTGVYSSPHIETIRERISVGGALITESQLEKVLARVRRAVEKLDEQAEQGGHRKNSFFEIITATALLHFAEMKVDKVVLEVGLGGRLDSTNVCEPELCVITNISLDHTRQLGSTVDQIAREKAGIIKRGVPVVSGVLDPVAAAEIHETSSVNNSDLIELGTDFHLRLQTTGDGDHALCFDTYGILPECHSYHLESLKLSTAGEHQAMNAAIAVAALNMLPDRFQIPPRSIRRAIAEFGIIGRGEVVCRQPLIVLDMAHNVASAGALAEMLKRLKTGECRGQRKLIFASSRDKDLPGMLSRLLPMFEEVVFTRFVENPRATDPQTLLETAVELFGESRANFRIEANPEAAWASVGSSLSSDDLLCVAGSAFLVSEMRPLILRQISHVGG